MVCGRLAGFSGKVVAAFLKGFPPTWKEMIQEYLEAKHSKRLGDNNSIITFHLPVALIVIHVHHRDS